MTLIIIALLWVSWTDSSAASEPVPNNSLRTFDTYEKSATLVDWKESNVLVFQLASGEQRTVMATDVVRYGLLPKSRTGQGVLLVDGSFLVGRIMKIDNESCQIKGAFFNVSIPRPLVRSVLLNAPGNLGFESSVLNRAIFASGVEDHCYLVNGDQIPGTLISNVNGILYQPGKTNELTLESSGTPRSFPGSEVRAIVLSPLLSPLIESDSQSITIGLADGSRIIARSVDYNANGFWSFQLVSGLRIRVRATDLQLSDISYLGVAKIRNTDRQGITILGLDDALRLRQTPLFGAPEITSKSALASALPTEALTNVSSGWLPDVFSLSAGSQVVFKLPVGASRFKTELAAVSPTTSIHTSSVAVGIHFDISIVRPGGKTETLWRSERRDANNEITFVDLDVSGGLAVILSVNRAQPTSYTCDGVWIVPLVTRSP